MNSIANTAHQRTRSVTAGAGSRVRTLRSTARRVAAWWSDDAVSAQFTSARERDHQLQLRAR
jgi:hypothetical protein